MKTSKYAFLRSSASLAIIGLLLGLISGFKVANSMYRGQRNASLNRQIAQASQGMPGSQAEVAAVIEKAKANPNDVAAQLEAAGQFIQIERSQEALPFLEAARKADPNEPRANVGLGLAYFSLGQYDKAIEALNRAREQGSDNPGVSSLLIGSYIQTRKNLDEAERLLKDLEAKGNNPAELAQIRADLEAAKSGGTVNSGAAPGSQSKDTGEAQKPRTTLSHGPEEPKMVK